jgi:hypothetical protein
MLRGRMDDHSLWKADMTDASEAPIRRWTLQGWNRAGARVRFELSDVAPGPSEPAVSVSFTVNETEHVISDHAVIERNVEFLSGIDPGYFRNVAEVYSPFFGSDDKEQRQRAATAMRLAYSMALETFAALIAVAVQAPHFALGWMLRYRNSDLDEVIRKLRAGEQVHSALSEGFSWLALVEAVHEVPFDSEAVGQEAQIKLGFAKAWKRFAGEFIDETMNHEYNSLKHGLRARQGGFTLSVALPESPGVAPPVEAWTPPSGSSYGSTFFTLVRLQERRNWALKKCSRNWVPDNMMAGLVLLSISINNLIWFLRSQGGDPTSQQLQRPSDLELFLAPWAVGLEWDQIDEHPLIPT